MDDRYLTITELSERIKYSKQSIYNLVHKKIFIQQKHYFKPTPKKLLFKWDAIKAWVERDIQSAKTGNNQPKSTINI